MIPKTWIRRLVVAGVLLSVAGTIALAQELIFGRDDRIPGGIQPNSDYDGRFVFIRLRYSADLAGYGRRGYYPGWFHDYPRADTHLMRILEEITLLRPRMDGSNIIALDEPELFNFPLAYMSEPGQWFPSEKQVESLRAYIDKGGFIIFDDFAGPDIANLEAQMRKVFPDNRWVELDGTHPIFHSFFEIDSPRDFIPPYGDGGPPVFYGMYEDNDPQKRLIAIANYNNDIGEYWEFSDTGLVPIDLSNEAYKFGVNYIVYGMTH
jgi:hypothetical protein